MNRLEITEWNHSLDGWKDVGVGSKFNRYVAREDSKWGFGDMALLMLVTRSRIRYERR